MKALLGLACVFTLVLVASAGCIDANGTKSTTSSSPAGTTGTHGAGNSTANGSVPAPVASIKVSFNGTELVAKNGSLSAKAKENLTFDGTNSTGKNLTYAWSFGDNATAANATANHSFAKAGVYDITLNVTNAAGRSNSTHVLLNVTGGAAAGGVLATDKRTFSGSWVVGEGATCGAAGSGVDSISFAWTFNATVGSTKAVVNHVKIVMSGGTTNVDTDLYFLDPSGKELGSSTGGSAAETIELTQKPGSEFAPGKYTIRADACAGVDGSVSITAQADYVAAP